MGYCVFVNSTFFCISCYATMLYGNKILREWGIGGGRGGVYRKEEEKDTTSLEDHVHGTERVLNTEEATIVI